MFWLLLRGLLNPAGKGWIATMYRMIKVQVFNNNNNNNNTKYIKRRNVIRRLLRQ